MDEVAGASTNAHGDGRARCGETVAFALAYRALGLVGSAASTSPGTGIAAAGSNAAIMVPSSTGRARWHRRKSGPNSACSTPPRSWVLPRSHRARSLLARNKVPRDHRTHLRPAVIHDHQHPARQYLLPGRMDGGRVTGRHLPLPRAERRDDHHHAGGMHPHRCNRGEVLHLRLGNRVCLHPWHEGEPSLALDLLAPLLGWT